MAVGDDNISRAEANRAQQVVSSKLFHEHRHCQRHQKDANHFKNPVDVLWLLDKYAEQKITAQYIKSHPKTENEHAGFVENQTANGPARPNNHHSIQGIPPVRNSFAFCQHPQKPHGDQQSNHGKVKGPDFNDLLGGDISRAHQQGKRDQPPWQSEHQAGGYNRK